MAMRRARSCWRRAAEIFAATSRRWLGERQRPCATRLRCRLRMLAAMRARTSGRRWARRSVASQVHPPVAMRSRMVAAARPRLGGSVLAHSREQYRVASRLFSAIAVI
jgi:hypothetical protein